MIFNPQEKRISFYSSGLERLLRTEDIDGKPIGNYAFHDLQQVCYAWLIGLHEECNPALERVFEWSALAICNNEEFGESYGFHHSQLHWVHAIADWMLNASNNVNDWLQASQLTKQYWKEGNYSEKWMIKNELDDYMAFLLQSSRYEEGISIYEKFLGDRKNNVIKNPKPRDYAYAVCLSQINEKFSEEEVFKIGCRMLQSKLEDSWLGYGQSIRAVTWLKIVFWDKNWRAGRLESEGVLQAVLKAYDNMPRVIIHKT